jgi:(2Fe-2S) ferredoxin
MVTYGDVCWYRRQTIEVAAAAQESGEHADVCRRMQTYADVCWYRRQTIEVAAAAQESGEHAGRGHHYMLMPQQLVCILYADVC